MDPEGVEVLATLFFEDDKASILKVKEAGMDKLDLIVLSLVYIQTKFDSKWVTVRGTRNN